MSCTSSSTRRRQRTAASFCGRRSKPNDPASDCYELNIAPADNPFPTGSLVARQKAAIAERRNSRRPDEWHTFDVTAEGGKITVVLDGERVLDYTRSRRRCASATSGCSRDEGPVAFRNIRLRPMGLQAAVQRPRS